MVTWLELYILYRIRGNPKPIHVAKGPKPKATLAKHMTTFKRQIRGVAAKVFLDSDAMDLFKPHKARPGSLEGVGITGKHQGLSMCMYVNENEQHQIAWNLSLSLEWQVHQIETRRNNQWKSKYKSQGVQNERQS